MVKSHPICPHCNQPTKLVGGDVIYPHRKDLAAKKFWHCAPCKAWVGCHPGSSNPLGRPANAELRLWKQNAHAVFDALWKGPNAEMSRTQAYKWLQQAMGLTVREAHIGEFDVAQCKRLVHLRRVALGKELAKRAPLDYTTREYDNDTPGGYNDDMWGA